MGWLFSLVIPHAALLWGLGVLQEQTHVALLCNDGTFSCPHTHTDTSNLSPSLSL